MRSGTIERNGVNNQCARDYVKQTVTFIIRRKSAGSSPRSGEPRESPRDGRDASARETWKRIARRTYADIRNVIRPDFEQ